MSTIFRGGGALVALWVAVGLLLLMLVLVRAYRDRQLRRQQADEQLVRERLLGVAMGTVPVPKGRYVLPPPRRRAARERRLLQTVSAVAKWDGEPRRRATQLWADRDVDAQASRLVSSMRSRRQLVGVEYFAARPIQGARHVLISALRDGDRKVRVAAAYGLSGDATPETARAVLAVVSGRRGIGRVFGSDVLFRMGPRVRRVALEALSSPDPEVRMVAADALGQWRVEEAVPRLEALVAQRRQNGDVALRAAAALGFIGQPRSVPALAGCLGAGDSAPVRFTATLALGRIDDPAARGVLSAYLGAGDDVARLAAEALGRTAPGRELLSRQTAGTGLRARVAAWGLWNAERRFSAMASLPLSDVRYQSAAPPNDSEPGP